MHQLEIERLRALLLNVDGEDGLAVSAHSTLEPLCPLEKQQELRSAAALKLFVRHTSYQLPCDTGRGHIDNVHCFVLDGKIAAPLNVGLTAWALQKEARARPWGSAAAAGRNRDASAKVSNDGGYQSFHDIFAPPTAREMQIGNDEAGKSHAHRLHAIASRAVDELMMSSAPQPGGHLSKGTTGDLHLATAWLNVHGETDSNHLHVHEGSRFQLMDDQAPPEPSLWCAVYYVSEGVDAVTSMAPSRGEAIGGLGAEEVWSRSGGRMIFRAGERANEHAGKPSGSNSTVPTPSFTFMAVPPVPGCLWLFPGSVPHCVLGKSGKAQDDPQVGRRSYYTAPERVYLNDAPPRISIGINFKQAFCEPPTTIRGLFPYASLETAPRSKANDTKPCWKSEEQVAVRCG